MRVSRAPHRGVRPAAVAVAIAVHALGLFLLRVPVAEPPSISSIEVDFRSENVRIEPAASPLQPPEMRQRSAPSESVPSPHPSPAMSPLAPLDRTIPPTVLRALREAPVPLTAGPVGIERKRAEIDPRRIAVTRAESLLASRIATLPGVEPRPKSSIDLSEGGGVTLAVPWAGFLPEDLKDEAWRDRRCSEAGRDDDKPGEARGRRAQCD